jgi:hypothetical protein
MFRRLLDAPLPAGFVFGHKRQRFTSADECSPLDLATVSTKEKFRASGHHTSFSFS